MPRVDIDGIAVNYYGPPADEARGGFPLVLVHGAAGSGRIWQDAVDQLNLDQIKTIAFDLPGHGGSEGESSGFIESHSNFIEKAADYFGWRKIFLVGHSMGGAVSVTFALRHPDRLAALGLFATGARLKVAPIILQMLEEDYTQAVDFALQGLLSDKTPADKAELLKEVMTSTKSQTARDDFMACNNFNAMGRLEELDIPTLVVAAQNDYMTPVKYSEYLASCIPEARLEVLPDTGHMLMLEQPEKTIELLSVVVNEL